MLQPVHIEPPKLMKWCHKKENSNHSRTWNTPLKTNMTVEKQSFGRYIMWYTIYIYTLYYILLKLVFFHCHPSLPSQRLASRLASLAMGTWESHWNSSTNVQPIDPKTKLWGFALFGQEESGMLADSTTKLESANRTKSHDLLSSQPATLLVNASAFPSSAARCKRERSMTALHLMMFQDTSLMWLLVINIEDSHL